MSAYQVGGFVAPNRITLAEFVEPWLDGLENQGVKATTFTATDGRCSAYVLPSLGRMQLQALSASDLDSLYARLARSGRRNGTGLALTTVHHVHAALNKLLHDAERKGSCCATWPASPTRPSLTAARSKAPDMKVWTPAEMRQFLESIAGNRNEAMFRLMALTGMRRSEVRRACGGPTSISPAAAWSSITPPPSSTASRHWQHPSLVAAVGCSISTPRPWRCSSAIARPSARDICASA